MLKEHKETYEASLDIRSQNVQCNLNGICWRWICKDVAFSWPWQLASNPRVKIFNVRY